ncbi:MAG: BamA/OMP85 family outer membrane protein [Pirellulaceae bacterium]
MVKTLQSNIKRRTIRRGLLLALWMVLAPGCAGMSNTEPRSTWPEVSRGAAPQAAPQAAAPQITRQAAPQNAPAPSPAQPEQSATGSLGSPPVTVRGQNDGSTNDSLPGSDAFMRYPMSPSGASGDTQQFQATGKSSPQVVYQPPTPPVPASTLPAPTGPVTATVSDNNQWLMSPYLNGGPQGSLAPIEQLPGTQVPVDILVEEARTGRFMFGAGINSDAGVTGQITVDERNFDLFGFPRKLSDIWSGEAWRGAGQGFRLEAMPGNRVQRYLVSFTEPYLFSTPIGLNVSGYLFDRGYYDWDENRVGGRLGLSYRLTPDLSLAGSLRMEDVDITDPRVLGVPELDAVLGSNDLYSARFTLRHDTRDLPFLPTEGHLIEMSFEQAFGEFDYPRAEVDYRRYFLIRERPDGSGRHVLSANLSAGFSGEDTPLFENYFAGGFSTLRGFAFRGASPVVDTVTVGGRFRMLGSFEYMLPLTADDMIRAVAFVDYGTVEQEITIQADNFRVAPGFGFRISVPALGPAPLAFDFAFPVAKADTDDTQVFSFFFGFGRG